jgi:hypothetical protein
MLDITYGDCGLFTYTVSFQTAAHITYLDGEKYVQIFTSTAISLIYSFIYVATSFEPKLM